MNEPILTADEIKRLAAIKSYKILDTKPEKGFDDITRLAAQICQTPIAAVSIVDGDRVWFKSKYGFEFDEIERSAAYCGEAIKQDELFIVTNGDKDARFAENPYVGAAENNYCFYAGVPLINPNGHAIGTLCVSDERNHDLTDEQKESLIALAGQVEAQFELRQKVFELENSVEQLKQYGYELAASRSRYFSVVETLKEAIFQTDINGCWTLLNQAWTDITGFSVDESLGETAIKFIQPADRKLSAIKFQDLISGKKEFIRQEARILTKNNSFRWIEVFAQQTRSENGNIVGTSGVFNDITDRKTIEKALRESEERYRIVAESANDGIITINQNSKILFVNSAAERIFGYTKDEMVNNSLMMLMPENLRAAHAAGSRRYMETGVKNIPWRGVEVPAQHKDGRKIFIEISFGEFKTNENHFFTGIIRDITERKRIAAELLQAKEDAEAATKAKSEFLANMSHEIRTPMNSVIGLTGLLLEDEMPPEQRDILETVNHSAEALLTIINDILDFSKIEAGRLDLEIIDFEIQRTIGEVYNLFAEQSLKGNNKLSYEIAPKINRVLRGDPGRLRQILTNLVGNAVKFTTNGKVKIFADVKTETAEKMTVKFRVSDTGIGIAAHKCTHLFKAFSQADGSITRQFGGTGLGLAICKQLVELMNGEIGVESELHQGSTFWFTAVFDKISKTKRVFIEDDAPKARAARYLFENRTTENLKIKSKDVVKPKILIADDNAVNQKVALLMLNNLEYRADVAGNGLEVIDALRRQHYDIVLMDIQMPEMDGLEATRFIRREWNDKPYIIAMTANAMRGDRELCLEAGMNDYLSKPVRKDELQNAIERFELKPIKPVNDCSPVQPANIDFSILDSLAELSPEDAEIVIKELITMFVEDAPEKIINLRRFSREKNSEQIRRVAHALKGTCATLGALKMVSLAANIENQARFNPNADVEDIIEQIEIEFDKVRHILAEKYQ